MVIEGQSLNGQKVQRASAVTKLWGKFDNIVKDDGNLGRIGTPKQLSQMEQHSTRVTIRARFWSSQKYII
jgi:hypothetical protein